MSQPRPSVHPPPANPLDVEKLVEQFEEAWQHGLPPRLGDFLALASTAEPDARAVLLEELVKVDLECRWSLGVSEKPRLEDYAARHPELGRPERLPVELIGEEYRVRQRWGDRPSHAEYVSRFALQGPQLLETLQRIDAELTAEFKPRAALAGEELAGWDARSAPLLTPEKPPAPSIAALVDGLRRQQLVTPAQLEAIAGDLQRHFPEPRALGKELLQRGWLTAFQLNLLLQGRGAELAMGPYVVLERLGEGGMGQVFKARHQRLERVFALKLIRKDLLADPEIVSRFYREIQVISRLEHPNIIHAYDAGPLGPTHFLAMEYVEGTDLQRLVRQSGPLPLVQACSHVHQAALGLQYAHEKGLVHRDIKPSNLLLAAQGSQRIVKILDLGLARLQRSAVNVEAASSGANATHTLTPVGSVLLGTPDYVAPEQALDFHQADIRADIYSLGCTLFFLLTGQPPFAGGTVVKKLWQHQQADPPDPRPLCPAAPSELAALLQRMLAKRPEARFQTPADVAAALEPFLRTQPADRPATRSPTVSRPELRPRGWTWRRPAATVLLASAGLLAAFWFFRPGDTPKVATLPTEPRPVTVATNPVVAELEGPFTVGRLGPAKLTGTGCVSSDGRWVAYLSDSKLYLWNRETQKERILPLEEADKIELLAFSPDGKYLGVLSAKMVRVWSVEREEALLLASTGRTFAFAGNSRKVGVVTEDATLLYELTNPRAPSSLARSSGACALSEDGGLLAFTTERDDQKLTDVLVKRTASAAAANRLVHFRRVFALTFAPSLSMLAVTATPAPNSKGPIHLVDAQAQRDRSNDFAINLKAPSQVCFAGNGQLLLAVGGSEQLHCWSVTRASGRILASKLKDWKLPGPIVSLAARDRLAAILLNDGKLFLLQLPEPAP